MPTRCSSSRRSSSNPSGRICASSSRRGAQRDMRADGRTLTARIVDLTHDCEGVADVDGKRVFVPDALPGELVELTLRKRRRKLQEAELVRVLEPSPDRVQPGCE